MTTSDDTQDNTGATEESSDPTTGSDDSGDPSSTDSSTSDPGTSDPGTTDPGTDTADTETTDPGASDSNTADSGSTGPENSDTDNSDTGNTDPATTDSDGTDPATTDSDGTDPGTADAGESDSTADDGGSTDTGSTDTGSTDTGSTDTGSTDTGSTDTGSTDTGSTDTGSTDSDPAASEAGDGATASGSDAGTALPGQEADAGTNNSSSSGPVDLGPPYLIVDQYSGDSGMNPPWATLVGLPQFSGAILKAWEGTAFNDGGWFAHNWPAVRQAGADRYGSSWFRGAYLFLKFNASGAAQADAYLKAVDAAGGWDSGDILPVVDVELGGATNSNHSASKQQVIDCVSECTARLKEKTGRRVMLYGRGAMRDLHIAEKMGADVAWNPSYTPTMHKAGLEGFTLDEIVLWQYCGDNESYLPNYPHQVKGFAKLDISVFIKGSAEPTLDDVRSGLLT